MVDISKQFLDIILDLDENWRVEEFVANHKINEVEIRVLYVGKQAKCPSTLDFCGIYDHSAERRWRHLDLMNYKTYITCKLPRIKNSTGKVVRAIA